MASIRDSFTTFESDSLEESTLPGIETGYESGSEVPLVDSLGIVDGPIPDPIKAVSGSIDPRIKFLSYSSTLTLHACPRKFQLYRLRADKVEETLDESLTFAFGHAVGEGIQLVLQGKPYAEILFWLGIGWKPLLTDRDVKRKKSFAEAIQAIRKFIALREAGFLEHLELVYINGKPACELGFSIVLFDNFRFRGSIDAVFRDIRDGSIIVLECKTTWHDKINSAQFKNSSQALGYSVVLDRLFPGLSSYSVLYLVYSTSTLEYTPMPFPKSFESRAEWIRSIVFDVEDIIRYEEAGIYPRRGESCFEFFKPCEYLNSCNFSTSYLAKPFCESAEEIEKDEEKYEYKFNLVDLIQSQINRNTELVPA
mgnify:CR=1 FL=1